MFISVGQMTSGAPPCPGLEHYLERLALGMIQQTCRTANVQERRLRSEGGYGSLIFEQPSLSERSTAGTSHLGRN